MDPVEIAWSWKEYFSGFCFGCLFWQYKYAIYQRVYDWWNS